MKADPESSFAVEIIQKIIQEISKEAGGVNFSSQREKQKFVRQLAEIIGEYKPEFKEKLIKEIQTTYSENVDLTQDILSLILIEPNFRIPSKKDIEFIAGLKNILDEFAGRTDQIFDSSIQALITQLNRYETQLRNNILKEIASGGTLGRSFEDIGLKIKELFLKEGIESFTRNNRNYSLESEARKLVRHSLITGRQRAVIERALSNGHDLIKISSHGDQSPMCEPHAGKIFSITGSTEGYPLLQSALWNGGWGRGDGVGHFWCKHSFLVYIPTNIKFKIFTRYGKELDKEEGKEYLKKEIKEKQKAKTEKDLKKAKRTKEWGGLTAKEKKEFAEILSNNNKTVEIA